MWHDLRRNSLWLLAPLALALGACDDDPATPTPADTVVDVALGVNEETGEFSTLIAALVAADLVDTLSGAGPFTVFAPTDEAFAAAGLNADNIGEVPLETLRGILLFHVAAGRLDAANVTARASVPMLSGSAAGIAVTAEGAFIEEARIVQTDVAASNGIIHVIDAVLLP